jgi:hypothetical protein
MFCASVGAEDLSNESSEVEDTGEANEKCMCTNNKF